MVRKKQLTPGRLTVQAKTGMVAAGLFLLFGPGSGFVAAHPSSPSFREAFSSVTVGDYFSCEIPVGWQRESSDSGLSQEEKKIYGFDLVRYAGEVVPLRISMHYYAEGNLLYATPEKYIAARSHPVTEQAGSYRYGEVFDAVVAGRSARTFMRPYRQFVPAEPLLPEPSKDDEEDPKVYEGRERMARKVPLIERYVVIPTGTGFFALGYSAPEDLFEEFLGVFEHVVATFRPLR